MYTITFLDGEIWRGGDIADSKWKQMPNKPIKKIEHQFLKSKITLENFEAYNRLMEKSLFSTGKILMTKIYLMAKEEEKVLIFILDFQKQKIYRNYKLFGQEYYNKPTKGWRIGIKNMESIYKCEDQL